MDTGHTSRGWVTPLQCGREQPGDAWAWVSALQTWKGHTLVMLPGQGNPRTLAQAMLLVQGKVKN